jgi:hypothetical protein
MLISLVFCLQAFPLSAQLDTTYCACRWQADSLFSKGEFLKAAEWYSRSRQSELAGRREDFKLAICYANAGKKEAALEAMRKAVYEGLFYLSLPDLKADTNLQAMRKWPEWPMLEKGIAQNMEYYVFGSNKALRQELIAMRLADQLHRSDFKIRDSLRLVGRKNAADSLDQVQMETDSRNEKRMKQILREYGWPGFSLVGYEGDNAAWIICQHADKDIPFQERSLKYLKEAVLVHNTQAANYAYLLDRILVRTNRQQVYGTQFQEVREGGHVVDLILRPVVAEGELDKRRNCVGLPPSAQYKREAMMRYSK